jgi:hypothetical protein
MVAVNKNRKGTKSNKSTELLSPEQVQSGDVPEVKVKEKVRRKMFNAKHIRKLFSDVIKLQGDKKLIFTYTAMKSIVDGINTHFRDLFSAYRLKKPDFADYVVITPKTVETSSLVLASSPLYRNSDVKLNVKFGNSHHKNAQARIQRTVVSSIITKKNRQEKKARLEEKLKTLSADDPEYEITVDQINEIASNIKATNSDLKDKIEKIYNLYVKHETEKMNALDNDHTMLDLDINVKSLTEKAETSRLEREEKKKASEPSRLLREHFFNQMDITDPSVRRKVTKGKKSFEEFKKNLNKILKENDKEEYVE